jgi:hypothetical protein
MNIQMGKLFLGILLVIVKEKADFHTFERSTSYVGNRYSTLRLHLEFQVFLLRHCCILLGKGSWLAAENNLLFYKTGNSVFECEFDN